MPTKKLVYSLREVCRMTQLPDSIIKRWEKEFPQIKPVRNRAFNRSYLEKDLKLIFFIRDLIYVHKLSIEEVRDRLKGNLPKENSEDISYLKRTMAEVKIEVKEIQQLLK